MSEYDQLMIGCTRSKRGQSESVMFRKESVAADRCNQRGTKEIHRVRTTVRVPAPRPNKNSIDVRKVLLVHLERAAHALAAARLADGVRLLPTRLWHGRRRPRHALDRQRRRRRLGRGRRAFVQIEAVRVDRLGDEVLELGEGRGERDVERGYAER